MAMEDEVLKEQMKKAANKEARVFVKNIPRLKLGLAAAITTVAGRCYAKGLITQAVFKIMFQGEWNPDHNRAQIFVLFVLQKLEQYEKTDPEAVKRTINTLATIVGRDGALEHIAKIIGKAITKELTMKSYTNQGSI